MYEGAGHVMPCGCLCTLPTFLVPTCACVTGIRLCVYHQHCMNSTLVPTNTCIGCRYYSRYTGLICLSVSVWRAKGCFEHPYSLYQLPPITAWLHLVYKHLDLHVYTWLLQCLCSPDCVCVCTMARSCGRWFTVPLVVILIMGMRSCVAVWNGIICVPHS